MKRLAGNFTMIPNNYVKDTGLDAYEFRVLSYLLMLSDDKFCCFPSYETISEDTGISLSKVKRAVKNLVLYGCIIKNRQEKKRGGFSANLYTVCVEKELVISKSDDGKESKDGNDGICDDCDGICDDCDGVCDDCDGVRENRNQYIYITITDI